MKKILIISYFFKPSNFVGAKRINFWSENLHKNNIYPVIITRNWNKNQKDTIGIVENNNYKLDKNEKREIHFLKHKNRLRDHVSNLKVFRKILTFLNRVFFFIKPSTIDYYNFFIKAVEILTNEKDIKYLIISGGPFESFYFGFKLKKKFPRIQWIPDYRDQWTTYQDIKSKPILSRLFLNTEKKLEKKWTSNCLFFLSTSPIWAERISKLICKKGIVIGNGYDGEIIIKKKDIKSSKLKIIYAGTLYPNQNIELFLSVISELNRYNGNKIEVEFIGCEMIDGQLQRLKKIKSNHFGQIILKPRLSKYDLQTNLLNADLMYLTNFNNIDGWFPVKLYDYARYPIPIILFPTDNSIMADFIKITNCGFAINSKEKLKSIIQENLALKLQNKKIEIEKNLKEMKKFSRGFQTSKLADILKD